MESAETILITGSEGIIGQILMARLAPRYRLFGLDLAVREASVNQIRCDISNYSQVSKAFEALPPVQLVIHLAGDARQHADWPSVLMNNIHGTRNIYEAAREHQHVRRIVFASSNHAAGYYEGLPPELCTRATRNLISPHLPGRPDGPYGIGKLAGESIARYYFDRFGIESVCLRIGSVLRPPGHPAEPRHLCTWLSNDDLERLIVCSLQADKYFPGYGIYFGVSDNARRFWDISNALEELEYDPQDKAEDHSLG